MSVAIQTSPLEITAYSGGGKTTLVILNRSTSAVNNAVVQVPQTIGSAQYFTTSQAQGRVSQSLSINGQQVSVNVGADACRLRAVSPLPLARSDGG